MLTLPPLLSWFAGPAHAGRDLESADGALANIDFARDFFGKCGFPATLKAHIGMHLLPNEAVRSTFGSAALASFGFADHADGIDRETQRESKRRVGATRYVAATDRTDAAEPQWGNGCKRWQCVGAATDGIAVRGEQCECRSVGGWRRARVASDVAVDGCGQRFESRRGHESRRFYQGRHRQWLVSNRFLAYCRWHASRLPRIDVAQRRDLSFTPPCIKAQRPLAPLLGVILPVLLPLPARAPQVTLPPFRFSTSFK